MKTHKLARQISASRSRKSDAQEQLNLLAQHKPDSGSEQGSFCVENGKEFKTRLDGPFFKLVQAGGRSYNPSLKTQVTQFLGNRSLGVNLE